MDQASDALRVLVLGQRTVTGRYGPPRIGNQILSVLVATAIWQTVCSDVQIVWAEEERANIPIEEEHRDHSTSKAVKDAQRLIGTGRPAEAYELLRRAMRAASTRGVDTAPIHYMAAQALIAGGHLAQAVVVLERLAEARPDLDRVRLDHAALLFTLGRDDEADAAFREMRRQERLPLETRRVIEDYLQRIRARQRWQLDFDVGVWHDDNVNNATEDETVAIPAFGGLRFTLDQRPVSAWVARTGARLRWRGPLAGNGRLYLESHASAARNTAVGESAYNRTWAGLSAGPRVRYSAEIAGRSRPGLLLADLGVERRWRGGEPYARGLWAGLGVEQTIDRDWRAGVFPRLWTTRYDDGGDVADPRGRSLDLYVARRIGDGWLTAGGKLSRESPDRPDLRWTSRALTLRYAATIGRDWSLTARAGLTRTNFDAVAPLFLARRKDRAHNLGITASHRRLAWEGYLPELTLSWSRTYSSIPLYEREVRTLRLGMRRLF